MCNSCPNEETNSTKCKIFIQVAVLKKKVGLKMFLPFSTPSVVDTSQRKEQRYPRRAAAKKCYKDLDGPNDDSFVCM